MLKKFVRILGGDPNKREIDRSTVIVDQVNSLEADFEKLSDEALKEKTAEFRARLGSGETLDDLLPEAFAAVREASKRTLGQRHYDVQIIGGTTLHQGKIAEMRTGEGKTLMATLPLYLNALTGKGTHLITVNDYLARRDARWMAPIYNALGMTVGVLQMAARTENGKKAFVVDLEKESPHEDQDRLRLAPRAEAYAADITYGTNSEFGFDYLRDNMAMRLEDRVQRGHYFAIIDEVDNVLIDEARTPLIISGPAQDEGEWYVKMAQVVRVLRPEDYEIAEKDRTITLTEIGEAHVEETLGMALRDPDRPEDVTPEQARMLGYLEQALRAQYLFRRNKDYLVQGGKVVIIDEFTGRLMPGRRWSDGLHQAVEAKEGVRVQSESVTYATITIQNYFRMYEKLAGMTGTAMTESEEFDKIYKLQVVAIPTNLEYTAMRTNSELVEQEDRDPEGYKYRFYAYKGDPKRGPVFWKRKDYPDVVYRTEEVKLRAIAWEILRYHVMGRPMLVGTTSVELSERVSNRLKAEPLRRLAQVNLLRQTWFEKNNREEDGRQVAELQFLNAPLDKLDINEMRKMARDLGIPFSAEDPSNLEGLLRILSLGEGDRERLAAGLAAGIPHEVLNARKHTEESQIIAGAGAFGAVTIATNMAGRGVDIKLGGELAEEILSGVARVLRRAGYEDPYDMTMEERREALTKLGPAEYSIYEAEVNFFLKHMDDMERVRLLGGLHVIGSERHEARRIDNQLRGRAARQGDPGSSRFYLSMEDELMRLFGGQQADSMMQRLKIDDALPLEVGLVSRIVEQSQTRVEGSNFDVRKHLLEYDDVLNAQRAKIYAQRNRIFSKEDLSEDVAEMLRTEVLRRVPEALKDEEGPWKLVAWVESIQPTLSTPLGLYPSYGYRLLVDSLLPEPDGTLTPNEAHEALVDVARRAIDTEEEHLVRIVTQLIDQTEVRLAEQIEERLDAVDTFFEGLGLEEEEAEPRRPADLAVELGNTARMPLKLTPEQQRLLRDDPEAIKEVVKEQVETALWMQGVGRMIGAVERRLEESIELSPAQLPDGDWDELAEKVLEAVQGVFARRRERFIGPEDGPASGQVAKDLESTLARVDGKIGRPGLLQLLMLMPQGSRASFDRKTHRRVWTRTTRLNYIFVEARLLEHRQGEEVAEDVLAHLEEALKAVQTAWGLAEWSRLANAAPADLEERVQNGLRLALGEERFEQVTRQPLTSLPADERQQVISDLGRQALTEIYRQLLLNVITELWVDYLTQMEALRVSIGLEAYAQRDPLVQYKNRASELFQNLLSDMRMGVVTRMFTYRPRDVGAAQSSTAGGQNEIAKANGGENATTEATNEAAPESEVINGDGDDETGEERPESGQADPVAAAVAASAQGQTDDRNSSSKKRRRRRR